ncbi:MAG: AmmeMemoRadiSam system radical SAM enzyme [Kiritimatiellae bacterium]|nr:AmmeMemoRadiSam system radical SAM enzyme [Kiritimatiellia bacterium]
MSRDEENLTRRRGGAEGEGDNGARAVCGTCPRGCRLAEGQWGACRARKAEGGRVVCGTYGRITALALDPVEKKPLACFHPGRPVLSVGGAGCNLRCPFCQNEEISQHGAEEMPTRRATPRELAELALRLRRERGNLGLAYTYNEPLVAWEFVRDCAKEARSRGLFNVLVSNGMANAPVVEELAPLLDAANIDLKGPSQAFYDWVSGDWATVVATIRTLAAAGCHVEVTTLVIPGRNDADADIDAVAAAVAGISREIPLHLTRFFPQWRLLDASPTPLETLRRLERVAKGRLKRVLLGNV